MDYPSRPDEWFARLAGGTRQRLIDEPSQEVPEDLLPEVSRDLLPPPPSKVDPGFWAVPDGKRTKVRGGGLLLWDYVRYVKLTALYVQYVRAMECRRVGRDEIRAPQHQLAADTIAELHAVDRDPAATWSEYERWLTMRPPGR